MHTWKQLLLGDAVTDRLRNELPWQLKEIGQGFLTSARGVVAAPDRAAADHWYASREGQETLGACSRSCWDQLDAQADHAMPAHDRRHAMIKVPSSALEYVQSEGVQGFERVGVLSALLHDQGRWAEERIFGGPQRGLLHARMSFVLAREQLEAFDMPAAVRSQILLAVLSHTSGAGPDDPMPMKLTVTADRDQLYGPEMILRLLHAGVPADGELSSVYGEKPGSSVLDALERLQRNRLPGPLLSMPVHIAWLQWVQRMFILMAEPREESRRRFAIDIDGPSLDGTSHKRALGVLEGAAVFDWESAWSAAQELRPSSASARMEFEKLLMNKHLAPSPRHKAEALKKLDGLHERHEPLLAGALAWTGEQLRLNDERQQAALQRIHDSHREDALITSLTSLLLATG